MSEEKWVIVNTCCAGFARRVGTVFVPFDCIVTKVPEKYTCSQCGQIRQNLTLFKYRSEGGPRGFWVPRDWCRRLTDVPAPAISTRESIPA